MKTECNYSTIRITQTIGGDTLIEVLFGESEAASMKAAKSTIIKAKTDGPTSVWIAGKKKPPKREHSGWIEGTAEEDGLSNQNHCEK